MHLKTKLLRGLKGKDRDDLAQRLYHSRDILELVSKLIEEKLQESVTSMRSKEAYDNTAWPYRQASRLGEQRAYAHVLDLLTLDREEDNG
jgi:hypothetical protein